MCQEYSLAETPIEIVVFRHVLEVERASNTGRLIPKLLSPARIVEYSNPDRPESIDPWATEGTAILFPGGPTTAPSEPVRRLILLDATWPQARRMYQRSPALHSLPKLSLPPPSEPLPRMRKTKSPEQMSTAEAAVWALRNLGADSAADHLEAHLRELVLRFRLPMRKPRPPA